MATASHTHADCVCVLDARTDLGESPVWVAPGVKYNGRLLFVDINSKKIHVFDVKSEEHFTVDTPEMVGCIIPVEHDEDLVVALMHRTAVLVNLKERQVGRVLAELPADHGLEGWRFNDGKATPGGIIVAGRMHSKWRDSNPGRLYRLDLGSGDVPGSFVELLGGIALPNGMTWDQRLKVMYLVDSGRATITAYPTDLEGLPLVGDSGVLEGEAVVQLEAGKRCPDGLTIDRDGMLWAAMAEEGCISCFDPNTGQEVRQVAVPAKRVTAVTFGGSTMQLDTMYITTRVEKGEGACKHWGGIFGTRLPGVSGMAPAYCVKLPDSQR